MLRVRQTDEEHQIDTDYQIHQVDNNIFYEGNGPERDHRYRWFEYRFFVFYKLANGISRTDLDRPRLEEGWLIIGGWRLGDYLVEEYTGYGPVEKVYRNEMIVRSLYNEYLAEGLLTDFKIRFRYPMFPS